MTINSKLKSVLLICAFGCFFNSFGQTTRTRNELLGGSQINTITTAVPFLMIAPDARAGSMGDVGVATSPDANSMHWNPAKYSFIDKDMGFSVAYSPWLRALVSDIHLAYLSGYKKIDEKQAIAGSLLYFSLGDITFTDVVGTTIGQYKPNEYAVDLAYTRKLSESFSGGVSARYIYSNLTGGVFVGGQESKPGISIATDVSGYYQKKFELGKQKSKFAAGFNISNIGTKISYTESTEKDFIPTNLRIGTGFTTELDNYNVISVYFDVNKLLVPTPPIYQLDSFGNPVKDNGKLVIGSGKDPNVSVVSGMFNSFNDAPNGFSEEMSELAYSIGIEWWYDKQFALRGGYFNEHKTKGNRKYFTLGAGLKYNVFGLDFSYLIPTEQRNPLENTLRFTLLFDFDALKETNKAPTP